jgi:hypothetical protein
VSDDASPPDGDLISQMGFTQVWKLHLCLYGPNCEDSARQILSIITLQWVNEALAVNNLYRIPASPRPEYVPENFMGQWWPRTDVEIQFNEQVNESLMPVSSAAGVEVIIETDTGLTEEITIGTVVV